MPEKPKFDLNKPYTPATKEASKPAFDPNKPVEIPSKSSGTDYSFTGGMANEDNVDDIINRLDTNTEDDKKVIKNLAIAHQQGHASIEDLSNAILTVQGKHPKQEGARKYYMKEENGIFKPIPIRSDEKPPKGYDINSIWGSQDSGNDDSFMTSAAKHLYNGVVSAAEGVANALPQAAYGAVTGEELPWYQQMKNSADYLKFKTPEYEKTGQLFDTKELKGVEDFFDPSRYDFSKNNVQGAVLQGLESITSFIVGAKGVGGAAKTIGAGAEGAGLISEGGKLAQGMSGASNTGKLASNFAGSYMVNYDEALTAAEDAGLEGQNKYAFASIATIPTAILEMVGGTEGAFVKNQLARNGKKQMFESLAKGIAKDTDGKLTKESLEGLYNATTTAATKLNKSFAAEVSGNIAGEAGTEAAQAFALNSAKNIYDKVSGEDKFKTNPFSLESFGEYVNNALAGGLGAGGPAVVAISQKRKIDRAEKQSNDAYTTIKKGPEAMTAFKADIDNSVANDELTPEQGEQAKFKVDAYNEYYQQTKGLDLNDEDRKKAFELSFNIQGIKTEIPTSESDIAKLSPIEHAQMQGKKEIVRGLQKELDAIILREDVKKETTVGSDTVNKVVKNEEKKAEETTLVDLAKRYGKAEAKTEEVKPEVSAQEESVPTRSEKRNSVPKFEAKDEQGNYEFNKLKPLEKKQALHDYFDEHPELNGQMEAHIEQGQNNVWQLDLGDKRYVQFGRAIVPDKYTGNIKNFPGGKKSVFDSDGREMIRYNEPVIVKIQEIKGTKEGREGKRLRVINVYNKQTGKYIISVKEREKGNSDYHKGEIEQFIEHQKKGIPPISKVKKPVVESKSNKEISIRRVPSSNIGSAKETIEVNEEVYQKWKKIDDEQKEKTANIKKSGLNSQEKSSAIRGISMRYAAEKRAILGTLTNKEKLAKNKKNKPVEVKEPVLIERPGEIDGDLQKERQEVFKNGHTRIKITDNEKDRLSDEGYSDKNIEDAESDTNKALSQEDKAFINTLEKAGLFNSIGNLHDWGPNLGMSTAEINSALKNIKVNKDTIAVKKFMAFIDKIKETGEVEMIGLTGGMTQKFNMPLYQLLLGEKTLRELSPEEVMDELEKEMAREEVFAKTGQFQKESKVSGDVAKVVERIKKSFPKVEVVYNSKLDAAGRLKGNRLEINPEYAGIDTPIHEAGHIMIDAIGYKDRIIQTGIKQLKETDLWQQVKEHYPELNEKQLGKEVLAEAIGREGANIFDIEAKKSRFKAVLDYIFTKLKQLLGIDKNVAKSLAKQIIGGINTEGLTGENETEQLSKKKPFKKLEEMSAKDLSKKLTMTLEAYRENVLGRSLEQIRKDLQYIDNALEGDEFDKEQKKDLKAIRENIKKEEKRDAAKWFAYKEDVEMLSSIMSENRLEDMPNDKLIEAYNLMTANFQDAAKDPKLDQLKKQIAYRMFIERKEELKEYNKFVEEQANKKDLAAKDVLMKTLSHMTENQPELQKFSKMFDDAHFDMQSDRYDLKTQLEKLGKEVIKEKNKSLGITGKLADVFSSDSTKYFQFIEHPDGRYYTIEEANEKKFSPAQIKFLKFMLELNNLRNDQLEGMDIDQVNDEVLKVDKGVKEAFKTEGILQAFSAYIGNGYNVRNVRISYKGVPMSYGEIEQKLINESKTLKDKTKALAEMAYYQLQARRQLKKGVNVDEVDNPLEVKGGGEYNLSTDGRLKSKFNKPRDKGRGYSKDFYRAAHTFIDDYTHVKHLGPLLPYIQSIEHINKVGFKEHGVKNNVAEWVKQWTDLHIFKKEKVGALGPELDVTFKLLRRLTSLTVMAFNIPAGLWNAAMGTYNNIRTESLKEQIKGTGRLLKDGVLNKKAVDILKKYQVVSLDYESNPKLYAGKIFDILAHGLTRAGEYYVQGSIFLGYLSDEDYDSFEYQDVNGVKELVVKEGIDEKALKNKLISYKNRISDIQGKYSEKDRRNYMAGEFGKLAGQFKTWLPDAYKQRFGEEYIDSDDVVHKGSYRAFIGQGFTDLKADIRENGINGFTENKEAMANLKGLIVVAAFMSLRLAGGDDKRRKKGDAIDQALGNLLFIFDINQLKFMVQNPVAAMGTLSRFVNVMEDAMKLDTDKGLKDIKKSLPYGKSLDVVSELVED